MKTHSINTYKHEFYVICPVNEQVIKYNLAIKTNGLIMVESIIEACKLFKRGFHEDIADKLFDLFRGFQVIVANHHGVEIETERGSL